MAGPIRPEVLYAEIARLSVLEQERQRQIDALGLNDLLPDVSLSANYQKWHREFHRGPVTEEGMLEAYRRGVQAGLEDAAQTANTIWKTDNDPKGIADVLGAMSRSSAYVSAVLKNKETDQ
jgi:hypothetical protein